MCSSKKFRNFIIRETRIAANGFKILALGNSETKHAHTEIYNTNENQWYVEQDYPFHESIYGFGIVSVDKGFYIFGGFSYDNKVIGSFS